MVQAATKQPNDLGKASDNPSVVDLRSKAFAQLRHDNANTQANHKLIEHLFVLEANMRDAENLQALKYFAVNELRKVIPSTQAMIFKRGGVGKAWTVEAVSALAAPDNRSPFLQWLNREVRAKMDGLSGTDPGYLRLDIASAPSAMAQFQYALFAYLPVNADNNNIAILFFSEKPFAEHHKNILTRLSKTLGHSWRVFDTGKPALFRKIPSPLKWMLFLTLVILLFVPVPLTGLAPAQIVSHQPQIISAPISGVIKEIYVDPNQEVTKGTLLYSFDKTEAQNSFDQASRKLLVAQSRHRRANQAAFGAGALKSEMAISKAEADLALSEKESFQRRLVLADVYAQSDGIVLFESVEKWIGRPVETGERVMQIADPDAISVKIDLPTEDAILMAPNARVKLFLDASPLNPIEAKIVRSSYDASNSESGILVFSLYAQLLEHDAKQRFNLQIGLRGTAQLFSNKVPLWFFLFRKPLSYVRQMTGF